VLADETKEDFSQFLKNATKTEKNKSKNIQESVRAKLVAAICGQKELNLK